uniref:Homeobox domain-containing protein n=1 Tax=Caenorhabditis tropicalis TaxID=1561998 RepID=A0A1I7V0Y7_9PELO
MMDTISRGYENLVQKDEYPGFSGVEGSSGGDYERISKRFKGISRELESNVSGRLKRCHVEVTEEQKTLESPRNRLQAGFLTPDEVIFFRSKPPIL